MTTAAKLKNWIAQKGLTQDQAAKILGTNGRQVRRWINGETAMSRAWEMLLDQKLK